jgi:hypothetical protein
LVSGKLSGDKFGERQVVGRQVVVFWQNGKLSGDK